ncbi:glyoxalase, partial [Streptomyces sp. TRM76130]|nr:glyoxalase [Streptomyces sp. TRM76130]
MSGMLPDVSPSSVWPVLHYDDTRAALHFLVGVLGFEQTVAVPDEHGEIGHAELRWPGGGALVFGSTRHTDSVHGRMRAG